MLAIKMRTWKDHQINLFVTIVVETEEVNKEFLKTTEYLDEYK